MRAPPAIRVAVPAGTVLLAVRDGVSDLASAALLDSVGTEWWDFLAAGATEADLVARVAAQGGSAHVPGFFAGLRARGLVSPDGAVSSDATRPAVPDEARGESAAIDLDADAVIAIARAVLRAGAKLRLSLRGASMGAAIPDRAVVEVGAARIDDLVIGDVALFETDADRMVAHRIIGPTPGGWIARGDAAMRRDVVTSERLIGRIERVWDPAGPPGSPPRELGAPPVRRAGRRANLRHAVLVGLLDLALARPVAAVLRQGPIRRATRTLLSITSRGLTLLARLLARVRGRIDRWIAVLQSSAEKDAARTRLYARRAIEEFTALGENVDSGLTLLEEVMVLKHGLAPGRALVLGCGPGREAIALAERGFAVVGVDNQPGMLRRAAEAAQRHGVALPLVECDITTLCGAPGPFDYAVIWSGLYNMLYPRAVRIAVLRACAERLRSPGGRVLITFLCAYRRPDAPPGRVEPGLLAQRVNPDHEAGDAWLLNEPVHVFPRAEDLVGEARLAGLTTEVLYRDQRAYDAALGYVKAYAILGLRKGE